MNSRLRFKGEFLRLSPSNATHGAGGGLEIRFADVVAGFFLPDHFFEPLAQFFVRAAAPQERAQVVLNDAEQAGANFSIGGQADTIAMAAEGLAHGGDDADFSAL